MAKSYVDIAANLQAFKEMAKIVRMSEMVAGIKNEDMGFIVLMECEMTGQTIFEWAEENHIVGGRPTMKYDAMVARFNSLPNCRLKLVEKSPERCEILLFDGEDEQSFCITWDELQKESIPYEGKESEILEKLAAGQKPKLKGKYSTPRSRAIMMYARLVSDAIRSTRPEVTKGRYTPEEVEDFADEPKVTIAQSAPAPTSPTPPVVKPEPKPEPKQESKVEKEIQATSLAGKHSVELSSPATEEQINAIKSQLACMKRDGTDLVEKVKQKLFSCGIVGGLAGLTISEADGLKSALEHKETAAWFESSLKGHKVSKSPT